MPTTLGHLHIPKTAGTSLNQAIAESLSVREVFFHEVRYRAKDEMTLALPPRGPARELALCYPFFSGHMSLGQLQALNRTQIFCVLIDPRVRLIKQYGWVMQNRSASQSILKWLSDSFSVHPDHSGPALHLIQNGPRPHDVLKQDRRSLLHRRRTEWIPCRPEHYRRLLDSLITIATTDPQEALNYLVDIGLLPRTVPVGRLNTRSDQSPAKQNDGDLPAVEQVVVQLSRCTATEQRFIDFLSTCDRHFFNLQPADDQAIADLLVARGLAR